MKKLSRKWFAEKQARKRQKRIDLKAALERTEELREFCHTWGLRLKLCNNNVHWVIKDYNGAFHLNWWPSSHKGMLDCQWRNSVWLNDVEEVKDLIRSYFQLTGSRHENAQVSRVCFSGRQGFVL